MISRPLKVSSNVPDVCGLSCLTMQITIFIIRIMSCLLVVKALLTSQQHWILAQTSTYNL